jgi:hypothetical protein
MATKKKAVKKEAKVKEVVAEVVAEVVKEVEVITAKQDDAKVLSEIKKEIVAKEMKTFKEEGINPFQTLYKTNGIIIEALQTEQGCTMRTEVIGVSEALVFIPKTRIILDVNNNFKMI